MVFIIKPLKESTNSKTIQHNINNGYFYKNEMSNYKLITELLPSTDTAIYVNSGTTKSAELAERIMICNTTNSIIGVSISVSKQSDDFKKGAIYYNLEMDPFESINALDRLILHGYSIRAFATRANEVSIIADIRKYE